MFKKLVLGSVVMGILTTSGFGFEGVKIDQNFCRAYNYANYNHLVDEKFTNATTAQEIMIQRQVSKTAGDQKFTIAYGALSTDMLKDMGIGVSINKSWGNITLSFNEFLKYANSKEDKKELMKFYANVGLSDYLINYKNNPKYQEIYRIYVFGFIDSLYKTVSEKGESENGGAYILTQDFAEMEHERKKILSPFARYVINGDYSRAKKYMYDVNAKSGINKIYSEFENACEK